MFSKIDPDVVQMMIYRAGLVAVAGLTIRGALRAIRTPDKWYLHGLARLPGMTRFAAGPLRYLTSFLFYLASACYVFKITPLLAAALMCVSFLIIMSLYQSGPWTGYFAVIKSGKPARVLFHLTHLVGLCVLGIFVAEIIAAARHVPRASFAGTDAADNILLQVVWSCIGAYYCISALSKLKEQGLRWVDRRLFPYYITFAKFFAMGDGYEPNGRAANIVLNNQKLGLTLLVFTLVFELSGALYPFGSVPRLIVGSCLIGFHVGSLRLLVPFNKNMAILLITSFNHLFIVNWLVQFFTGSGATFRALLAQGGHPGGDFFLGLIVFVSIIVISFILGERFYPFSVLSMFTAPYRPQRVCLIADATEEKILPMLQITGRTTLNIARELSFHLDTGGSLEDFIENLEARMKSFKGTAAPARYRVLIKTVDVENSGRVKVDEMSIERQFKL